MIAKKFSTLKWWQIVLISLAASAVGGLASGLSSRKEVKLYNKKLKQAPWAPPPAVFGPAWTINNVFLLLALQRIIKNNTGEQQKLLILQAMSWFIFFTFGYVYFNRRSPVLAGIWTVTDTAVAAISFSLAYKSDKKTAYYYLPLLTWTSFASTIAVYQALENADPVFNSRVLLN